MIPALFIGFAAMLLVSSLMVVLQRNPVTSALFLVVALCSLSGIYIMMHAEFVGLVQVVVYAGAIMVLFVFVIMYLSLSRDPEGGAALTLQRTVGWIAGAAVFAIGVAVVASHWALGPVSATPPDPAVGNTQALGLVLFTRFMYPFEIASLVLLVAMVGAIAIAKSRGAPPTALPEGGPLPPSHGHTDDPQRTAPPAALRPGDSLTPQGPPA